MLCAPILLLLALYLDALKDQLEYWEPSSVPWEIYCIAPIIGLVFFSIPYLLGSCILGWLLEKMFPKGRWLSITVGVISGLIGIFLIAVQQKAIFADFNWNMVMIVEVWSIMIFSWIGNRITNTLEVTDSG